MALPDPTLFPDQQDKGQKALDPSLFPDQQKREEGSIGDPLRGGVKLAIQALGGSVPRQFANMVRVLPPGFLNMSPAVAEDLDNIAAAADKLAEGIKAAPPTGEYARAPQTIGEALDPARIYQVIGQQGPLMAALAASYIANPVLGTALMFGVEGGETSKALEEHEKQTGKPINPNVKLFASTLVGAANSALERTGIEAVLGRIPGLKSKIVRLALSPAIEGGTEGLQEINQMLAQSLGADAPLLTPENLDQLKQAIYGGVVLGAVGGGISQGVESLSENMPEATAQPETVPEPSVFPDQPSQETGARPELALDFLLFPDQPAKTEAGQEAEKVPQKPLESPTIDAPVKTPQAPEAPVEPTTPPNPAAETPSQTEEALTPEFVTGIKHEVVTEERGQRELEELQVRGRRDWGKVWDEATEKIKKGEIVPRDLSKDLAENPRPITDTEAAVLDYERVSLNNIHRKVTKAIGNAKTEDEAADLKQKLLEVEDALNTNDIAAKQTGTETARGLAIRRAMVKNDYTLASVVQQARNANQGEQIPDDTRAKLERLTAALEDAQERLKEYEESGAREEGQEAVETIKREVRKQKRQAKKADLDAEYEDLIKEFAKTANNLNALVDPQQVALLAKMAANRVSAGVNTIEQLVDDLYAVAKDHINGLTKRDIRDAISGYGKYTPLTKDEIKLKLRDLREQARLISAIEDIEAGKEPLKSGFERKKQSDEAKELQQKLNQLKKQLKEAEKKPGSDTDPRLKAYKTRLKNEIARIEKGLPKKPRRLLELDAEAEALKQKLNELRKKSGLDTDSRLDAYKTRLKNEEAKLEQMIREGNFQKPAPRKKLQLDPQTEELKRRVYRLKRRVNHEIALIERKNRPLKQKITEGLIDIANIPRSFISSIDLSATLRQGGFLLTGHFREHAGAFKQQFKYMRSEDFIDQLTIEIEESPNSVLYDNSGLYLANKEGNKLKMSEREERFLSQFAERIPGIGALIRGSERAYSGFLDKLRMDVFDDMVEQYLKAGLTFEKNPEVFKALAKYINAATGRGDLGVTLNRIAPLLNSVFFSPRLIASRLNLLNPFYYAKLPQPVRVQAMKDAVKFVGAGMSILALAAVAGADVETDPRSSDFGKIRIGNMRLDIWGGFQQFVVLIARLVTGQTKSSTSGEVGDLDGKKFPFTTRKDLLYRFTEQKLSPSVAFARDLLSNQGFMGEDISIGQQAINLTVPLYMRDFYEATSEMGYEGAILSLPGFFGVGTQYYKPEEEKKRRRSSKTTD